MGQEFALHNLEEVLTNLIPIWDSALRGCLTDRLNTILTEIFMREEKRNAPVTGLRRSPRKNSKKRRKSGENEENNEKCDKVYEKQNSTESSKSENAKTEKTKNENSKNDNDFQSCTVHNL